ncbi:mediator of RNA polymerase II transcription subunit 11 isoform X1 [Elaeis guineensis]|uniref:Mediator of RNA polymerase II transcription subunit 11 n=1 Tax=Elaeis guineensis var. tenera TaxID=51953 RepID=A0A6I9SI29_ELAGV|nr:mediator of RNA polymerase II transcription subunit 11 isoform X1 [Elaeis guineensis]
MGPHGQTTSLQRLLLVEKRIVRVVELAGSVMDELANSTGPRTDILTTHCREFMQSIKDESCNFLSHRECSCEYSVIGATIQLEGNGSTWKTKCPLIAQDHESMDGEVATSNYMDSPFFYMMRYIQ